MHFECIHSSYLLYRLQISGNYDEWAENLVATMQQMCVDDVLMANYTELNDTQSIDNATSQAINELLDVRCEPFNCNDHGRCVSGSCACHRGERFFPVRWVTGRATFCTSSIQKQLSGVIFKVSGSNEIECSSCSSSSSGSVVVVVVVLVVVAGSFY